MYPPAKVTKLVFKVVQDYRLNLLQNFKRDIERTLRAQSKKIAFAEYIKQTFYNFFA